MDKNDVARALRRAGLCSKTLGIPVYPAIAGEKASEELAQFCQTRGVRLLLDGMATSSPLAKASTSRTSRGRCVVLAVRPL